MLARYVRDRHVLSLHTAIAKMTSVPARALGLSDRGLLKRGMLADVVVFDAATITDVATFTDPHHYSTGVTHLVINGTLEIDGGALTGKRPGHDEAMDPKKNRAREHLAEWQRTKPS